MIPNVMKAKLEKLVIIGITGFIVTSEGKASGSLAKILKVLLLQKDST